jgi:hypothetical protein
MGVPAGSGGVRGADSLTEFMDKQLSTSEH